MKYAYEDESIESLRQLIKLYMDEIQDQGTHPDDVNDKIHEVSLMKAALKNKLREKMIT